jgi:hypothetical protein
MKRLISIMGLTLCLACGEDEQKDAPVTTLGGTLDLELRDQSNLELGLRGELLSATLTLTKGFGVAPAGEPIRGEGRIEAFPEAESKLAAAKFSLPAQAAGPCGAQPVSLALALHRGGDNAYVAGSLTPYCGAQIWHGTPARTPLRLSGLLPLAAE